MCLCQNGSIKHLIMSEWPSCARQHFSKWLKVILRSIESVYTYLSTVLKTYSTCEVKSFKIYGFQSYFPFKSAWCTVHPGQIFEPLMFWDLNIQGSFLAMAKVYLKIYRAEFHLARFFLRFGPFNIFFARLAWYFSDIFQNDKYAQRISLK